MKAQDVFNASAPFFGPKSTFAEAFPEIQSLRVEVTERGHGTEWMGPGARVYTETIAGEFINCSNTVCYNGGFRLGGILRDMVRSRETERTGTASCQGYERSPKGRRKYRKCWNSFEYKIAVKYRENPDDHAQRTNSTDSRSCRSD